MEQKGLKMDGNGNIVNRLMAYAKGHDRVFLYGAGRYGELCLNILQQNGIDIDGFIVSRKNKNRFCGKSVYEANAILPELHLADGIIFSVKEKFQQEIQQSIPALEKYGLFFLRDEDFFYLEYLYFIRTNAHMIEEYPAHPLQKHLNWKNILIVRLDVIGDMIWTTAFLRELKHNFPYGRITIVLRSQIKFLLENCPYIDEIICYDCPVSNFASLDYVLMKKKTMDFAIKYLRQVQYDVVFLPRYFICGDIMENLFLAVYSQATVRIGRMEVMDTTAQFIATKMHGLFSLLVEHKKSQHEADRILDMLRACGCAVKDDQLELWPSVSDRKYVADLLRQHGVQADEILIAVGVVSKDENRSWDPYKYRELFDQIYRDYCGRIRIVLCGGSDARKAADIITKTNGHYVDVVAQTKLSEVAAIIERCDFYIGSNTGLLHMAAAFSKPVLEISAHFLDGNDNGNISPVRTGAWRVPGIVIQPVRGIDGCVGECLRSYAHCINQITVDEVRQALERILKGQFGLGKQGGSD